MLRHKIARRETAPGSGLTSRYRALLLTHRSLEEKRAAEMLRPQADGAIVRRIKRRKLFLKDEMASIERLLDAMGASFKGASDWAAFDERTTLDVLRDFHPVRGASTSNQGRPTKPLEYQSA